MTWFRLFALAAMLLFTGLGCCHHHGSYNNNNCCPPGSGYSGTPCCR